MVTGHPIQVELPLGLYERLQTAALESDRSVEAVLIDSLALLFGESPLDPENVFALLESYPDEQLWAIVHRQLAPAHQGRLHELIARGKNRPLAGEEQTELDSLIGIVDRYALLRSRALLLLKQRGHNVEKYLQSEL